MSRSDEFEPTQPRQLSGMDALFANTNIIVLVIFSFCCNGIALILGIVGLVVCKDPKAKSNAMTVTIISAIVTSLAVIGNFASIALRR